MEHLGKTVTLEEKHHNIMKSFYTTFKGADADLRFTFLTGVTKFSQISMFSGFNQPDDISLNRNYEAICGITKDELTKYFSEPINEFAEDYGCSNEEMFPTMKCVKVCSPSWPTTISRPRRIPPLGSFSLSTSCSVAICRSLWIA